VPIARIKSVGERGSPCQINWQSPFPINHYRGEGRAQNATDKITEDNFKTPTPQHLQRKLPGQSIKSFGDINFHEHHRPLSSVEEARRVLHQFKILVDASILNERALSQ
jgi:hypothetical protein